jgi:uncharacterized protein (DUF1499 family)
MLSTVLLLGCAAPPPADLGVQGGGLAPCPDSPNCVSSEATDPDHQVAAFELATSATEAWQSARSAVASLPRTAVVAHTPDYLHAECTSALIRYVDDLELQLQAAEGRIAVRSASRTGYSDMGVNRARVEELRALLVEAGAVRQDALPASRHSEGVRDAMGPGRARADASHRTGLHKLQPVPGRNAWLGRSTVRHAARDLARTLLSSQSAGGRKGVV